MRMFQRNVVAIVMVLASVNVWAQEIDTDASPCGLEGIVDIPIDEFRFVILNDGQEVLDTEYGLVWQRCLLGEVINRKHLGDMQDDSCDGALTRYSPAEAEQAALEFGNEWYVPNAKELSTLANYIHEGHYEAQCNYFPFLSQRTSTDDILSSSQNLNSKVLAVSMRPEFQETGYIGRLYYSSHGVLLVKKWSP